MPYAISQTRRRLLGRLALGVVSLPLLRLPSAHADDLPHLAPNDPSATPMHYTTDAAKLDSKTEPSYVAGSHCGNCALFHYSQAKGDWAPCDVFTTKAVNSHGWCLSHTLG